MLGVAFPVEVGGHLGQAAKAFLGFVQRLLRALALGDVARHGDDRPTGSMLFGVSPDFDPDSFAAPARTQHFDLYRGGATSNDRVVNACKLFARRRQHAFRSHREHLSARKPEHVAGS